MYTREASKKEVLNTCGKNTFRYIRETAGINFERPVIINHFDGSFSLGQVWKLLPHINYDYTVCIILSRNMTTKYADSWMNRYYYVKLTYGGRTGDFITELNSQTYFETKTIPDTLYRKSDFTEIRKLETACGFIIAQKKEYCLTLKTRENRKDYKLNDYTRYKDIKPDFTHYGSHGAYRKIITAFYVSEKEGFIKNQKVYVPFVPSDDNYGKIETFFDKSGYYVQHTKDELKRRAAALRAERKKAEYVKVDFTDQAENLKRYYKETREYIANEFIKADTYDKIVLIDNAISKIRWFSSDIDHYLEVTEKKGYSSIEQANEKYNNIIAGLNKAKDILKGESGNA